MKIYILLTLGVVIVAGGGYLAWKHMAAPIASVQDQTAATTTPQGQEEGVQQPQAEAFSGSGSIASLVSRGGNFQCTASVKVQNSASTGMVYISGSNVRGDFTSQAAGMTMASHMIMTGGYIYGWSDMVPQGYKTKATPSVGVTTQQGTFDANTNVEYDCQPWSPDQSKFAIPSTVTFKEMAAE